MPFINGRYYMNPFYGRALEAGRMAEEAKEFVAHRGHAAAPESSRGGDGLDGWDIDPAEIFYEGPQGNSPRHPHHEASQQKAHGNGAVVRGHHDPATTTQGVAHQVYNETSGLRPTAKQGIGPGSDWDMQQARLAIAHVIQNRAADHIRGGIATDQIKSSEARAIKVMSSPAYQAYGGSLDAAHRARIQQDSTSGGNHFYLDWGQPVPSWAKGQPIAVYGPFHNTNSTGDVPAGASVKIPIYKVNPPTRR